MVSQFGKQMLPDAIVILLGTHHCDIEGIQKVKGQRSNQVHKEPGSDIMNADGTGLINHLT